MAILKALITGIFLWMERLKGRHRVIDITPASTSGFTLTTYAVAGYEITIHCHKRVFRQEYARWFIPGRDHASYEIHAEISHDAPPKLKKACELEVSFPAFFSNLVDDQTQKKLAINAYLDLLGEEMLRLNRHS
jgi:hypothetical protein